MLDVHVDRSDAAAVTHQRVVAAAAALLSEGGPEAVSTRAVSAAAGVQAPTIYRIFGHKQGLLDVVATEGFDAYVKSHAVTHPHRSVHSVNGLRRGWDAHVAFGLAHPHLYALIYARPRPGSPHPAAVTASEMLAARVRRVAEAGQLRVPEERAVQLIQAGAYGTVLTLLGSQKDGRDSRISDLAREAVLAAVTTESSTAADPPVPVTAAIHLRAALPHTGALTAPERALLEEWLDRIIEG